jgi:hypothetical protein
MSAPASIRRGSLPASIGGGATPSEAVAPPPPFTVAELLSTARPLDLICLHAGRRASAVIQTVQELAFKDGSFTHVGVVVNTECVAIRNGKPGELYLWEVIPKPTEADEPCSAESGERKEVRGKVFSIRHNRVGTGLTNVSACQLAIRRRAFKSAASPTRFTRGTDALAGRASRTSTMCGRARPASPRRAPRFAPR